MASAMPDLSWYSCAYPRGWASGVDLAGYISR